MSGKRRLDLTLYFLQQSPLARYRNLKKIFTQPQSQRHSTNLLPSDKDYMKNFLDKLQVVQPFLPSHSATMSNDINNYQTYRRMFSRSQPNVKKSPIVKEKQAQVLSQAIRMVSNPVNQSLILYQQLEQILAIASPQVINDSKNKMVYLFKLLLNRRDKLDPNDLELEANLQLSDAIIQAFSKAHGAGQLEEDWKKLEAMEKLLRAKQYKKKGLEDIATNSFSQICKDQAASSKTRFQALQVLCSDSQKIGDTSILEPLMSFMVERGEKAYEDYLRERIEKIKSSAKGGEGNSRQ